MLVLLEKLAASCTSEFSLVGRGHGKRMTDEVGVVEVYQANKKNHNCHKTKLVMGQNVVGCELLGFN